MSGKILITGANGFFGSHCVERYSQASETEIVAVWNAGNHRLLTPPPQHIRYVQCDLTDLDAVRGLFERESIDVVLHTAALLPDLSPNYDERTVSANVTATVNLAATAREAGCSRFVFCSSVSVYGTTADSNLLSEEAPTSPEDVYAWSKVVGEQYVEMCCSKQGMTGISLRLSGLHGQGRRGGVFFNVVQSAISGAPIQIASSHAPFQFLNLIDAVEAARWAVFMPSDSVQAHIAINVASGIVSSLHDIATLALSMSEFNVPIVVSEGDSARCQLMNTKQFDSWRNWHLRDTAETLKSIFAWLQQMKGHSK